MKIRYLVYEHRVKLTTNHSASSYGQPVLIDCSSGEAIDKFSFACSEILEATPKEREALVKAGYLGEA